MKANRLLLVFLLSIAFLFMTLQAAFSAPTATAVKTSAGDTIITSTVTLTPLKDNTLYEHGSGNLSNGVGSNFFVGKTSNGLNRRGLMAFDLVHSGIPTSATILSATLALNLSRISINNPQIEEVSLHQVLTDWGEGSSMAPPGNEGQGAPATSGDATWLHTFYDTEFWIMVGGDFTSTVSASKTVSNTLGTYTWGSTVTMTADIQNWLAQPDTNYGWLLLGNETQNGTAKRFDTRENEEPANQPHLTITYSWEGDIIYLPMIIRD